jgi:hypothetical protein
MASWVPNPIYGDPNGGDFIDDLGQKWPDPTGKLRDQPAQAAGGSALAPSPLAVDMSKPPSADPLAGNPLATPAAPGAPPKPAPQSADGLGDITSVGAAVPPDPAEIMKTSRNAAGAAASSAPPDPAKARAASMQPSMINATSTTTDKTTGTQGLDKGSKAAIQSATGEANAAATSAGNAQVQQLTDTANLERKQATDAYGRGVNQYFEAWGQRNVQDQIVRDTTQRLEQNAQFKPDRAALFRGDHGLLFGISSAIAAMAGGWMMGRGMTRNNPFLDSITKMIDEDANDQIAQNSAVYRELTRKLGSAEAAQKELKARMYQAVNDTIESQTRFEKADLVQKGAAGVMAQVDAKVAQNKLDAAKMTADTVTRQVQTRTQNQLVPNTAAYGGVDVTDPKEYARVGKVSDLSNFASEAESLVKDGTLADNVGWFDEGWNQTKDMITRGHARTPGQARVDALKSRWELLNRADWASEPNGQETQQRLSAIAFPKNDSEIPLFQQRVREVMNAADPGGKYRFAAKAMGSRPNTVESGRTPIVR